MTIGYVFPKVQPHKQNASFIWWNLTPYSNEWLQYRVSKLQLQTFLCSTIMEIVHNIFQKQNFWCKPLENMERLAYGNFKLYIQTHFQTAAIRVQCTSNDVNIIGSLHATMPGSNEALLEWRFIMKERRHNLSTVAEYLNYFFSTLATNFPLPLSLKLTSSQHTIC